MKLYGFQDIQSFIQGNGCIMHEDGGHGWLQVPVEAVTASGFKPSGFSYKNKGIAYLEEDCDAPGFVKTITGSEEAMRLFFNQLTTKYHDNGFPGRTKYDRF